MEEYNKLVDKVRQLRVVLILGKDTVHRDYLIDLYTLNAPVTPKLLVNVIFSDGGVAKDHVNMTSGELVLNDIHYSLDSKLFESMEDCGSCNHYHPQDWYDDCRDDDYRYHPDDVIELFMAAPDLLETLKDTLQWVSKLIAERPDYDKTGLKTRAKNHYNRMVNVIAQTNL